MKSKCGLIAIVLAVAFAIFGGLRQQEVARLRASTAVLEKELSDARAPKPEDPAIATIDAAELQKLRDSNAELIKLRGEVSALRKEKEDWQKQSATLKAQGAQAAARATQATKVAQDQKDAAAEALKSVLSGPPTVQGTVGGNLRRKMLNGEPLNETDQAMLANLMAKSADLEKSPQDFAAFQSSYISSVLGWNNDPRAAQVQQMLTRATTVANEQGYNYNAPGQNADSWNEQQKALNARATGVVQGLLTPEERAVFDKAFIGVLGVDFGVGLKPQ